MRRLVFCGLLVACGAEADDPNALGTYEFGPYTIAPNQEVTDQCVQISLHNTEYVYVNSVELTTGPGFHHSNWFYVPDHVFAGADGTFDCDDRDFNEPVAAIFGGVLFAQSTQAPHEIQQFPDGVAIKIPPQHKLVTQIHLLNASDTPLEVKPSIGLVPIPEKSVTTTLAGMSFENQSLALPPNKQSRFVVECDIASKHRELTGLAGAARDPDFKFYYALAHYHELGMGISVEALREDGTSATVYTTASQVGDTLGGMIAPAFDMTGFSKIRFSCDFFNPRADTVRWGVGDQEMCVFLAFTDSEFNWGGGVTMPEEPANPVAVGNTMQFTNPCTVFGNDASR